MKRNNPRRVRAKPMIFTIEVAAPNAYPDLEVNPTNPFTQMSDEKRLEDIVETLGIIWAQTVIEHKLQQTQSRQIAA